NQHRQLDGHDPFGYDSRPDCPNHFTSPKGRPGKHPCSTDPKGGLTASDGTCSVSDTHRGSCPARSDVDGKEKGDDETGDDRSHGFPIPLPGSVQAALRL